MANFGRKMWAWKHSLKGIANTESEPQMITPPGVIRSSQFSFSTTDSRNGHYRSERWFQGGGYNEDAVDNNLTGFLYAKKVNKTLNVSPYETDYEYPCIDVTGNASDEPKFSYVRTSSASYVRTRLSWDLQNPFYDRYSQSFEPDDWYSTLAISSIVSYNSVEVNKLNNGWEQSGFENSYTGFTPYYPFANNSTTGTMYAASGNETANYVPPTELNNHYNTFKNVSGTDGLSCMYEIGQIKGSNFNWNEYEGGTPDFDIWGRSQYTTDAPESYQADGGNRKFYSDNEKIYHTFNGSWPSGTNLNAVRLNNQYAGKTVKKVAPASSRYAGDGNPTIYDLSGATGWIPDDSATIDIGFEVELALQRHGVSTHDEVVTCQGDNNTVTKKLMSYVAGNFCFRKGNFGDDSGTYIFVPVYFKLRSIGTEYQQVQALHGNNNNVSIRGNRPHTYKYAVVSIRLEKPWNVGSVMHGSGRVLDWETEYPTYKEAYPVVSGRGRGNREYADYYGGSSVNNPTIDNWEEPYLRVENRSNAEFLGNTDSLNGEVNPVTCLRISESGQYGLYSGGTVFENAPVGAGRYVYADQTASYTWHDFFYNGQGIYAYDAQSSERDIKVFTLSRFCDLSSISSPYSWDWAADATAALPNTVSYNQGRSLFNGGQSLYGGNSNRLYYLIRYNSSNTANDRFKILEWRCTNADGRPDLGVALEDDHDMHMADTNVYPSTGPTFTGNMTRMNWFDNGNKLAFQVTGYSPGDTYIMIHSLPGQYDLSEINTSNASYTYVGLKTIPYVANYDANYTGFTMRGWSFNDTGTELTIFLYRSYNQYRTPVQTRVNEIAVFSLSTAWDLSSTITHLSSKSTTWPSPYDVEAPSAPGRLYKPNATMTGLDGSAFYASFGAMSPEQLVGFDLGTTFDPSDQQPVTLEDSKYVITRFSAPNTGTDNNYADNYFFHVTDTPQNDVNNGYTGKDPFPNTGLSTVINSIDFRGSFPYAPGYDSANYPKHDVSGAFIRSFRLSNDGRFLYVLWVTATMISNSSSASIQQWVERYFINHPQGIDGEDAWRKGSSTTYIQQNGVYFSGTTDIYTIQGDSSGGYLSSATAIDVTPDGLHLQVLQSEAHKAGETNYKPMIVEHYLGGNDLGLYESADNGAGSTFPFGLLGSTNPRKPLRNATGSGTIGLDYHWPRIPCKPGLFAETGVNESDANYGNGGSNCAIVFDRTYLGGSNSWLDHRSFMQNDRSDYSDEDRSIIVAPSSYDIIPSDFSWDTEGMVLYLYGAYLEHNNDNRGTVGCQRQAGSPYVMTVPVATGAGKFVGCGQKTAGGSSPRTGYGRDHMYLYNNRVMGLISEFLATTSSSNPDYWVPGTLYRSYFYPVDESVYHRAHNGFGNYDPADYKESPIYIKLKYAYDATDGHRIVVDDVDPTDINGFNRGYHDFYVKKSWWTKSVIETSLPLSDPNTRKAPFGTICYYFDCSDPSVTDFPEVDTLDPSYSFTNFSWFFQGTPGQAGAAIFFYCPSDMITQGGASSSITGNIDFAIFHPDNYNLSGFSNRIEGGIRFAGNGRDFLEVVANPLFYARHGVSTGDIGDGQSENQYYDYYTAGSIWNYPTKYYVSPANRLALGDSYTLEGNANGARHSGMNMLNRSVSPPEQKNMASMGQTYPLASVFAHHKGGRYLYFVSENIGQDTTSDPNYNLITNDRFRRLQLSVIPIETQIEDSISGNTQFSRGYDTYWGQPPDSGSENTYPYNYRGWGYVVGDQARSVDGPRMNTEDDYGDWGAIHLSSGRNDNEFYLSMSSRISPDSATHWAKPYWDSPTSLDKDNHQQSMGRDSSSLEYMAGVYYTAYAGKSFANYDYNGLNSKVEGVSTELGAGTARHPQHQYKGDNNIRYWYGKDIKCGRWGLLWYQVDEAFPVDYITPFKGFSWGYQPSEDLGPGDSRFYNAGFMQNNWFAKYGSEDALDVPKFIFSNPQNNIGTTGTAQKRPVYFSVMQQIDSQDYKWGQVPPPYPESTRLGQTYITKQKLYNERLTTKLAKAYKDGGKINKQIPYSWAATNSYAIGAAYETTLYSNYSIEYADPAQNPNTWNVPSIRSFRFANKGKYLFVLIAGRTSEVNGQPDNMAAFSILKFELDTPYDISFGSAGNPEQYFTFYENTYNQTQAYDYWWSAINQPNCYFGSDFYMNEDGTKIWVIGLNSKATSPGLSYNVDCHTLLREFTLNTPFDFSTISGNGFATYDSQAIENNTSHFEVPVSLEVSPDGNNVYWSQQYMNRNPNNSANGLQLPSGNNYNGFSGLLNPPDYNSYMDESNLRHFRSTLPSSFNLKQPDQTTTETARNKFNQPITRTIVGVPWYATEGAAQRVRFSKNYPNRIFRSNLTSQKADRTLTPPNGASEAQYYNQVLNQSVGGFSSFSIGDDHKVQKVDGTWNIGNAGMFQQEFTTNAFTGDGGARQVHAAQDMFLFEVNDEENIVLISDTQLRIYSFVLNNSTKGY